MIDVANFVSARNLVGEFEFRSFGTCRREFSPAGILRRVGRMRGAEGRGFCVEASTNPSETLFSGLQ